ncbi:MAG TPA: hydrogenase maturation protease [Thiobacillaceae bacterium]|nr:hydrogenase maturation protease [Thiobacillaceae bacterium]HNF89117.1 hydrogenase maturation protease [Thiobacillaceae bacterium]
MNATTLVVGLGNPILGDDGVGWRVAERVRASFDDPDVAVLCLSLGGLSLVEHLAGYRRAVIVDAMSTGALPGTLHRFDAVAAADPGAQHTASVHDLSLASALALGRELGLDLPGEVAVVGVEAAPEFEFGAALSEAVARALPEAERSVWAWLKAAR